VTASDQARANEPLYLFAHVAKAGGTTVEDVLARRFGDRLQRTNPRPGNRSWPPVREPRCYSGHDCEVARTVGAARDDVRWLSWVRDPLRMAVSTYYYLRDVLVRQHPPGELFEDRGLRTWLLHEGRGGWPLPDGYGHDRMSYVVEHTTGSFDAFAFVGVTERFAESMLLMFDVLGWQPIVYRALNPTRARRTAEEQAVIDDPDVRAAFRERNQRDYALYEAANARLDELRAAAGADFAARLAAYERRVAAVERRRRLLLENGLTNLARRGWRAVYDRWMQAKVARRDG
jgi:hypothetical protein